MRSFKLTGFTAIALVTLALVVLIAIPVLLLLGAAELSVLLLDWMPTIFAAIAIGCAVLYGPMALMRSTRARAGTGLLLASFLFGVLLWVWSLAFTYETWGLVAVIIGLLLVGIGIVPVAMLAAVVEGDWNTLGFLALLFACTYVTRAAGAAILKKAAGAILGRNRGGNGPASDGDDTVSGDDTANGVIIEGNYKER